VERDCKLTEERQAADALRIDLLEAREDNKTLRK